MSGSRRVHSRRKLDGQRYDPAVDPGASRYANALRAAMVTSRRENPTGYRRTKIVYTIIVAPLVALIMAAAVMGIAAVVRAVIELF